VVVKVVPCVSSVRKPNKQATSDNPAAVPSISVTTVSSLTLRQQQLLHTVHTEKMIGGATKNPFSRMMALTVSVWVWTMMWCCITSTTAHQQGPMVLVADESTNRMLRQPQQQRQGAALSSSSSTLLETTAPAAATADEEQSRPRRRNLQVALNLVGGGGLLGECEGDCDRDSDCASGLKCFQRTGSETVPGCTGDRRSWRNRDFCVKTQDNGDDTTDNDDGGDSSGGGGGSSGSSFRIKMYWQQGYYWQEERIERKWCLDCRSGRCGSGVEITIRKCDSGNTRFEFVGGSGGQVQIKVTGQDLCLELMESNNRDIKLQKCTTGSRRQLFTAGPGDFNGSRFELQPVQVAGCLSQPHHPRDGELIRRQNCAGARFDTTSYYNKY
jgi:hypothetical protein